MLVFNVLDWMVRVLQCQVSNILLLLLLDAMRVVPILTLRSMPLDIVGVVIICTHVRYRKIAGDKCVNGNETFYLPVSVECPVEGPADMSIIATTITAYVGQNITFTLLQRSVSLMDK